MRFEENASTTKIVDSPDDRPIVKQALRCGVCNWNYLSPPHMECPNCASIKKEQAIELTKLQEQHSCLVAQQGGDHYQGYIQPVEYIHSNKLNFNEGNAIKYVTRNRRKGSAVGDLKKAIHYLQLELKLNHRIDSRIEYDAVPRD